MRLRLITYLVPGIPLTLYELYRDYLQQELAIDVCLQTETRWSGPPPHAIDPLTANQSDVAFLCSTSFLRLSELRAVELLPVAPVHIHPRNPHLEPIYFSDVITHKDNGYDNLDDLRGCRWGYNDSMSLSGNVITLDVLDRKGTDLTFFSSVIQTGSHHESIEMVANKTLDGAAIDSTTLAAYSAGVVDELTVVESWGPMPIQPLAVRAGVPDRLKTQLSEALLCMNQSERWRTRLLEHGVWGFKPMTRPLFDDEQRMKMLTERAAQNSTHHESQLANAC